MNYDKSLKNFFSKKEARDMRTTNSDDYAVKNDRRTDLVLRIISLLGAIVIWVCIVIGDSATQEFTNFSVTVKGGSILQRTYDIKYDFTQVNFKIQGQGSQVSQISENDVQVYVDLSAVSINLTNSDEPQTFDLPLIFETKNKTPNIVFVEKSRESIKVTFTKKTS
jgi:hypothetical protein